jgi:hypothetical protein
MLRKPITFLLACLVLAACESSVEDFEGVPASDFAPLQPGKYFIYQLDSMVFTQQGRKQEFHKYQEKQLVDAIITDNLGRPSYRMFRYLRDSAGTNAWVPTGTFLITATQEAVEYVESNRRIVRLGGPVSTGRTWKGGRYLNYFALGGSSDPYSPEFNFLNDDDMFDWNYSVEGTGETVDVGGKTYSDVATVVGIDHTVNVPVTDPTVYATRSLSIDKFARNIGLVYQELTLWEYQPNPSGVPFMAGFGVTRKLIEHN